MTTFRIAFLVLNMKTCGWVISAICLITIYDCDMDVHAALAINQYLLMSYVMQRMTVLNLLMNCCCINILLALLIS